MNIIATAVPSITDHFHTVADVGWYSSAFRLCQCSFQFAFGKAYKLFSIKRIFLLANVVSIGGSLVCGAANTSRMLIAGRAVAGVGSAGLISGCFVILVRTTPLRRRPMFTGMMGAVEGVSTLAAPLLGGVLVQSLGWRWCFYINAPTGAITLLLTFFCLPDLSKSQDVVNMGVKEKLSQLDLLSNTLLIPALTALFIAFSWAGTKYPWNTAPVIVPLVAFAFLMAAFIYNQVRRGAAATLPPHIMRRRSVLAGFIFVVASNSTGNVLEYYLPTYYQVVRGYSPAESGYMMLPFVIAATVGALMHGFGTSIFGYYTPFMLFGSVMMPIAAGLMTTVKANTTLTQVIVYTTLSGLGYGIGFSGPQNAVQTVLPTEDIPIGTSILLFAQAFGPAVTIAIAQVLFIEQLVANLSDLVPGLSGANIENLGLNQLMENVTPPNSEAASSAIDTSLTHTWYLAIGLACMTMVGSLLIEWKSVKSRRD
ncbi:MFS general substrate transporter [Penicillium chermesinum]|nr:MFS general substrate transporter [Penicillium chermesinum]